MKVCPCGKKVVKGKIAQMPHTADAPDGASAHEAGVGFGHTSRCREICLKREILRLLLPGDRKGRPCRLLPICGGSPDRCYGSIAAEIGAENMPPACFLYAPTPQK